MSTPLSLDLRVRVLAAVASGLSRRQAGERFGVSAASVSRGSANRGAPVPSRGVATSARGASRGARRPDLIKPRPRRTLSLEEKLCIEFHSGTERGRRASSLTPQGGPEGPCVALFS